MTEQIARVFQARIDWAKRNDYSENLDVINVVDCDMNGAIAAGQEPSERV